MNINGFTLVNEEKVNRAINGTPVKGGALVGGVGADASPELILAKYDSLGGLILEDGQKVVSGSFWDFAKKEPRKEPEVKFEFRDLDGDIVVVAENEELPVTVKAKIIKDSKKEAKKTKKIEEDEE